MSENEYKNSLSASETLAQLEKITRQLVKIERLLAANGLTTSSVGELDEIPSRPSEVNALPYSLRIDSGTLKVIRGSQHSPSLTAKELQIMTLLNEAFDRTISRRLLANRVWNSGAVSSKTLDVHIFNLRRKLETLNVEILFQAPDSFRMVLNEEDSKAPVHQDGPVV